MEYGGRMEVLLRLPGRGYNDATIPYQLGLKPFVDKMSQIRKEFDPLARLQAFVDYSIYCRWPIRQLEYSFIINHLPSEVVGRAVDVGSGVTPWPYFMAKMGWPTISIDSEVNQVNAMRRFGSDFFGFMVDHRVGDVRGLGFSDGIFAVVTSISVLEHNHHSDIPIALSEMVRICQPGGRIILTLDICAADHPYPIEDNGPLSPRVLKNIFSPIATACGMDAEFKALEETHRNLAFKDLEEFWTLQNTETLWAEKNRGYIAAGMVFDLPKDLKSCHTLMRVLRENALSMDFPPKGKRYHRVQVPNGPQLWMIGDEIMTEASKSQEFESDVRTFFEHFVHAGDTVFDVGANIGLYIPLLSDLIGRTGHLYAFEPTEDTFGCLVRNSLTPLQNIRLNRMGQSHESGPLKLYHAQHGNACLNSFGEPFGIGMVADGQYISEDVWVTTLDDYVREYEIPQIDLIKIDVEGWEERVLRGGIATLLSMNPVLILEFCTPAAKNANSSCSGISSLLKNLGYDLYRYHSSNRDLEAVQEGRNSWVFANLIAIKRQSLSNVITRLKNSLQLSNRVRTKPIIEPLIKNVSHISVKNRDAQEDIIFLLEENRALRERLMAGILDNEVSDLHHHLQICEADRAARLKVIEELCPKLDACEAIRDELSEQIKILKNLPEVKFRLKIYKLFKKQIDEKY